MVITRRERVVAARALLTTDHPDLEGERLKAAAFLFDDGEDEDDKTTAARALVGSTDPGYEAKRLEAAAYLLEAAKE